MLWQYICARKNFGNLRLNMQHGNLKSGGLFKSTNSCNLGTIVTLHVSRKVLAALSSSTTLSQNIIHSLEFCTGCGRVHPTYNLCTCLNINYNCTNRPGCGLSRIKLSQILVFIHGTNGSGKEWANAVVTQVTRFESKVQCRGVLVVFDQNLEV